MGPWCQPIVVTGLPRSGTTAMHRELAAVLGNSHRPFPFWDLWTNPKRELAWRRERAEARLGRIRERYPNIDRFHPIPTIDAVDDADILWCNGSMTMLRVRLAQRARLDKERRPWLFQSPRSYERLDELRKCFPGAQVVVMDRDWVSVAESSRRLCAELGVDADRTEEGLATASDQACRLLHSYYALAGKVPDWLRVVAFSEFIKSPATTAQEVADHFGKGGVT